MKIAGLCTPHSLFFFPKKKRECAVHGGREKKTFFYGGRRARLRRGGQVRMILPAAGCGRGLGGRRMVCPSLSAGAALARRVAAFIDG